MKKLLIVGIGTLALAALLVLPTPARAGISILNYWRMGEADPGATPGATAVTAVDSASGVNLNYSNSTASSLAKYSSDVPVSSNVNSTISVSFTNGAYAVAPIPPSLANMVDNFGIEAWVKASPSSGGVIVYVGHTGTSGWGILLDSHNHTYAGLYGGVDLPGDGLNPASNAITGVWEDVALVRQNGLSILYVNGIAQPYEIFAGPHPPVGNLGICTAPQVVGGAQGFTGLVDEVRIFTFTPGQFSTTNLWVSTTLPPPTIITNRLALGTTNLLEGGSAGTDSVLLNDTLTNHAWTAAANNSWLHVSGTNQSGVGNSLVIFSYDANPGAARTGTLTIASQTVTVTQTPANYSPAGLVNNILPSLPNQSPSAMAVDSHDNVYFWDENYNTVWEWISSSQTLTNLQIQNLPEEPFLAADASGNLFFTSGDGEAIEEWILGNQTVVPVITNLQEAVGLCVDASGNVYVSDDSLEIVEKWSAASHTVTNLFYPTNFDAGPICADLAGDVYMLSDGEDLWQWTASNRILSVVAANLNNAGAIAIDGATNIYIAALDANTHLGDVLKWNASLSAPVEIFSEGAATFFSMAADAAGNVYFSPSGPYAVDKWTATNQTITHLITAAPALANAFATDASGNLYIADLNGAAVGKWMAATGNYAIFITAPLQRPTALAFDTVGNVYVADGNLGSVFKFSPSGAYLATIATNLFYPNGLTFDAAGNLYILEDSTADVLEWIAASNTVVTYIPSALLSDPQALAMDVTGRMYIADRGNYSIDTWDPVSQTIVPLWSVQNVAALAVDGSGNIYTRDNSDGNILRWQPKDNSVVTMASGNNSSSGIVLDGAGNLFLQAVGSQSQAAVIPHAFLNTNAAAEGFGAGGGSLPAIIPSTFNLASFAPSPLTDQPWLRVASITNGMVSFSFAANTTGDPRTGHLDILGQAISVTQTANPPLLINPVRLSNSVFTFGLTNLDTNNTFTVLTSTNIALPLTNWTVLGTATNAGLGMQQFTDKSATNSRSFYIAR